MKATTKNLRFKSSIAMPLVAVFTRKGSRIVIGGWDLIETAQICSVEMTTGKEIAIHNLDGEHVKTLVYCPKSGNIFAGCYDTAICHMWHSDSLAAHTSLNLYAPAEINPIHGFPASTAVSCASFSADSKKIAVGSWDRHIRVFDFASSRHHEIKDAHELNIDFVSFANNDRDIISGTADQICVWNAKSRRLTKTVPLPRGQLWIHAAAGEKRIISVSYSGNVKVWNLQDWSSTTFSVKFPSKRACITSIFYWKKLDAVAISLETGHLFIHSLSEGNQLFMRRELHGIASMNEHPSTAHLLLVRITRDPAKQFELFNLE